MALFIVGKTPCSLCGSPVCIGDDIVATTHFIGETSDPLWRYSDSVMHRRCFDGWEHREEFGRRYRETLGSAYPQNEYYRNFPGPPGCNILRLPPPEPPPVPPEHYCPTCGTGLTPAKQGECDKCGWLRYPSDRTKWGSGGSCPNCQFSYRYDGRSCSHCGASADRTSV